jgi:hypothetical protein
MKLLVFCTCIFSLPLASQSNFCIEKVPQKYLQQSCHFSGVENGFSYEKYVY